MARERIPKETGKEIRGLIHRAEVKRGPNKSRKDTGLKFTRKCMRLISHYKLHGPFLLLKLYV